MTTSFQQFADSTEVLKNSRCDPALQNEALEAEIGGYSVSAIGQWANQTTLDDLRILCRELKSHQTILETTLDRVRTAMRCARLTLDDRRAEAERIATFNKLNIELANCATSGNLAQCVALIELGADVNAMCGPHPRSALMQAASNGHTLVCRELLNNGAEVGLQSDTFGTALHLAAAYGHLDVCRLLLDCGADINGDKHHYACQTPLHGAVTYNHASVCQELLSRGAAVSNGGANFHSTALHVAIEYKHFDIFALLLESPEVDIQASPLGRSLVQFAASRGQERICKLLLDRGAPVDSISPHTAAKYGLDAVLAILLRANIASINEQDRYGCTALHLAASRGNVNASRALLDHGACLEITDKLGRTPLHRAAERGFVDLCLELISRGADLHSRDLRGETPLTRAIMRQRPKAQMLMIAFGADTNEPHAENHPPTKCLGMTPLEAATALGNFRAMIEVCERDNDRSTLVARISAALAFAKKIETVDLWKMQMAKLLAMEAIAA
jgi:ankyrin repeat protein